MVECDYCDREFAHENSYLDHLESAHFDELGRIDRRRIEHRKSSPSAALPLGFDRFRLSTDGFPQGHHVAILLVIVGTIALIYWAVSFTFVGGGGGGGNVHEHGTLVVTVNDERIDFDQSQYRRPTRFHFHTGDGTVWHMHPDRFSFEEAMAELGIPVTASSITIDGTTYEDTDPGTSVVMEINGEAATLDRPLQEGDRIEIVVETGS